MKKLIGVILLALLVLAGVLVVRTLMVHSPATERVAAAAPVPVDHEQAAQHLAGAVRFPTVSLSSGGPIDTTAFLGLHQYLADTYPLVTQHLQREAVGGLSLLYTWRGTDSTLPPLVLMGHMDVVPVPTEALGHWTHPPFAGEIADGFVWGRGTLDDKVTVVAVLEAVESLLQQGFQPTRTVYLCFGHDEEVSGRYGARRIVDLLVSRGVKPYLVLDEGGAIAEGLVPGVQGPTAIVGIAEKGYVSLTLTAKATGGHSSMPPRETAVGTLSRAIEALENHPFPLRLTAPVQGLLQAMAPWVPFGRRIALANLWLTRPVVTGAMSATPSTAAMLRTTTAPTMLQAGIKDNVLPPEATAVVNFRILPGETIATVRERVTRTIADDRVTVALLDSTGVDPSPVSDVHSPAYAIVTRSIRQMLPGQTLPVLPYLVMGGTDAKYWAPHSDRVFRFLGVPLKDGDLERVHGTDERVGVDDFATSVGFFTNLIRNADAR
jgi:carboxypeptidase PM20D1